MWSKSMSKKKGYQKYTSEFKEEAVKIAMNTDQPYSATAKELGINLGTFYKWTSEAMNNQTNPSNQNKKNMNTKILEIEIKELRKKLKKTEMERDILKKAAAYFANQDM